MFSQEDLEQAFLEGYLQEKAASNDQTFDADDLVNVYRLGQAEGFEMAKTASYVPSTQTVIKTASMGNTSINKAANLVSEIYADYREQNLKQVIAEWEAMVAQNSYMQ
jgi:hypothetical protein